MSPGFEKTTMIWSNIFHIQFFILHCFYNDLGFPGGLEVKKSFCNAGDPGSILRLGIYPGEGTGCPLQYWASQVELVVKSPPANAGDVRDNGLDPWVRKIPWRRAWQSTPVFLLENPMDRKAWWATVHGVAQSWTQLSDQHYYNLEKQVVVVGQVVSSAMIVVTVELFYRSRN